MIKKAIKPLIFIFIFSGAAYCFVLVDQKYSAKTIIHGSIISVHKFRSRPMLFHAQVNYHGVIAKINLENGMEIECSLEKIECNKTGDKVILDQKKGFLFKKISYENIRCE